MKNRDRIALCFFLFFFLFVVGCVRYGDQPISRYSCNDMNWTTPLSEKDFSHESGKKFANGIFAITGTVLDFPWLWINNAYEENAALKPYSQSQSDINSIARSCVETPIWPPILSSDRAKANS
jgi:hypothetical protein